MHALKGAADRPLYFYHMDGCMHKYVYVSTESGASQKRQLKRNCIFLKVPQKGDIAITRIYYHSHVCL